MCKFVIINLLSLLLIFISGSFSFLYFNDYASIIAIFIITMIIIKLFQFGIKMVQSEKAL